MIHFPENFLSLLSLILCFFFLQGGIFFLYCYLRVSRNLGIVTREHLYFSLMSFGQALYSFGAWNLYSVNTFVEGRFWERFQWVSAILVFVFFIHFSTQYLRIPLRWRRWTVDLPAPFFFLMALLWPDFITQVPHVKSFTLFGHPYKFFESESGPLAYATAAWFGFHILAIFFAWFYYLGWKLKIRLAAVLGLMVFVAGAFHELFVALGFYHSPYVLEYGFFIFSVAFYFQLFLDFFDLYRLNLERSSELTRLVEESRLFINTVSHDLKSPLLTIEGFATILEDGASKMTPEQRQDYLKRISKNANHLMNRLSELKNFINIGMVSEEIEPIHVKDLIDEILKGYEMSLKGYKVRVKVPEDLRPLHGSRKRVQDVFMNLIDNCLKYCQKIQGPELTIHVNPREEEMEFMVGDNGPGIDPLYHDKVFDLFYRADTETGGTGIGLAAVKKIVTRAGGRIWLESELGKGTKIFFTLPIRSSMS